MVSDLFPGLTDIGPLPIHALISNDSHGEIVNGYAMILTAHDLGGYISLKSYLIILTHVSRCATRILSVIWVPHSRDTEIGNPHVPCLIKHKILRLDVSMQDTLAMQILQAQKHASHEELGLILSKLSMLREVISQIATRHNIYDKI
jgi:hypothetical protein